MPVECLGNSTFKVVESHYRWQRSQFVLHADHLVYFALWSPIQRNLERSTSYFFFLLRLLCFRIKIPLPLLCFFCYFVIYFSNLTFKQYFPNTVTMLLATFDQTLPHYTKFSGTESELYQRFLTHCNKFHIQQNTVVSQFPAHFLRPYTLSVDQFDSTYQFFVNSPNFNTYFT